MILSFGLMVAVGLYIATGHGGRDITWASVSTSTFFVYQIFFQAVGASPKYSLKHFVK